MRCARHAREMKTVGRLTLCAACAAEQGAGVRALYEAGFQQLRANELDALVSGSGIPDRFLASGFDAFEPPTPKAQRIAEALRNYAENFTTQRGVRPGFIFTGPPGTAKTHLACAMALTIALQGFSARYVSLPRLTMDIRRTYKSPTESAADIVASLSACDFLVLDEIDLHGASDADYQSLYEIVNSRYEAGDRPTLAISNRTVGDLTVDLNERLITRLLAGTNPIAFDWEGRRLTRHVAERGAQ